MGKKGVGLKFREETRRVCTSCAYNIDPVTGHRTIPTQTQGGKKINYSLCKDCADGKLVAS